MVYRVRLHEQGAEAPRHRRELEDGAENLRPGMTARSTILAGTIAEVLCIPVAAVFIENAEAYCYVEKSRRYVKSPVVLGSQNEVVIEVRSGLAEGDSVSLVAP